MEPAPTLLVVGAGLIGASVGLAARVAGWRVWLDDRDPAAVELAVRRGAGEPLVSGVPLKPDLVLVAVPPRAASIVIDRLLRRYVDAIVSDATSIKAEVIADVEARSFVTDRFVPGHPLGGGESSGPNGARDDLFRDRPWVLTPTVRTDPAAVALVERFVTQLGAVCLRWDAHDHDRAVALTSHLPQLVSSALAAQLGSAGGSPAALAGQGLRDMTRIAGSDPGLWTQILSVNAGPVAEVLSSLHRELGELLLALRSLAAGDEHEGAVAALHDVLERGRAGRGQLPGKHGSGSASPTASLVVAVPDRPGELARLFATAAAAGVNLEDVRIDHVLGRLTGLVELDVAQDRVVTLRAVLSAEGWRVADG